MPGRHSRKPRWGQNFLVNEGACRRIVESAGDLSRSVVVEVGPGRGALTRLLATAASRVVALEIDPLLAAALREELGAAVAVRDQDALAADWSALADEAAREVVLVANLPYETGTPILSRWLEASARDPRLPRAVVMLQREVAQRVGAAEGSADYGVLGALARATHRVTKVMDVAPGSFRPAPKVWSRVIRLERRERPDFAPSERDAVTRLVHAAFAHRRKQVASALDGFMGRTREQWQSALRGVAREDARAQDLSPADFAALARPS